MATTEAVRLTCVRARRVRDPILESPALFLRVYEPGHSEASVCTPPPPGAAGEPETPAAGTGDEPGAPAVTVGPGVPGPASPWSRPSPDAGPPPPPTLGPPVGTGAPPSGRGLGPEAPRPEDCPFDLEVAPPYAVDLRRFLELSGQPMPPEIEAKLGSRTPVLVYHRLTPFAAPGERPRALWGLGYTVRLIGLPSAATVDFLPRNMLNTVASFTSAVSFVAGASLPTLTVGLGAGGEFGPLGSAAAPAEAAGLVAPIGDAQLSVSVGAKFTFLLNLKLDLEHVAIQAGPAGAGGARWNLYRRDKRLDVTQSLVHTLIVPSGQVRLRLAVATWIRQGGFIGLRGTHWAFPSQRFTVSLEGLAHRA